MKKPIIKINSDGEQGNIFYILALASNALRRQYRIADYNELRDRVYNSKNYKEALAIVREYVEIVDIDNQI